MGYLYFNPNPECKNPKKSWHRGDCTVRSLCKATGQDWETVFLKMCKIALTVHDMPNCKVAEDAILKHLGFVKGSSLKPERGDKWPTVAQMARWYKNETIICLCVGHMVCCKGGKYHDVWDCGNYTVRSFWILKK